MRDLNQEQIDSLRTTADRLELRGDDITATYFRNRAWVLEHGDREWLDDANVKEVNSNASA